MSKLKKRGATSTLSKVSDEKGNDSIGITTVKKKVTTSYKVPPLTLRMSLVDKQAIAEWVDEVNTFSHHKASPAKLYRALLEMKNELEMKDLDKLNEKLAGYIDKML